MVHLLLDFVESERDSIWQTHIERFCSMLPYYRSFDHNRYGVIVIDIVIDTMFKNPLNASKDWSKKGFHS